MQVPPGASPVTRRLALAGAIVALDQATKSWAVAALADEPANLVGDAVRLRLVRNSGSAFSLFTGWTPILGILAIVLIVVLWRMGRQEADRATAIALAVVLGGALGNLSDRIFRAPGFLSGAVIDFVDVGPWPTFNVADSAITVGAVLLILRGLRRQT
ncbi:MAG: signal peptidase II [Actinobacteria bacterium]|nr:signal peptidase II [Actinomycetota bacterium]